MLKDNFCSSPWFHIRLNPSGNYRPCRWISFQKDSDNEYHMSNTSIMDYMNSTMMKDVRTQMLAGEKLSMCEWCHYDDSVNKVSGRKIQLLKSAVNTNNFDKTFCSSPHYKLFNYSHEHRGETNCHPVDLQIDLGNTCNGACIMCTPTYSSKLANDYVELNKLEPKLFDIFPYRKNWTDDPALVDKFVSELAELPNIKYIHFLGGETLYLKSFYTICNRLIDLGIAKEISIGTTTNCSVYNKELEHIIKNFKHVHLGLSVEKFHSLNDYIRWPSNINQVTNHIQKFIELRKENSMHLSLRITPNIFSIFYLDTIFEFMLQNRITAESCTVLREPPCLRAELLPPELIKICADKLNQLIVKYNLSPNAATVINRRHNDFTEDVITDTIFEFKYLFENMQPPVDVDEQRQDLVKFIQAFEQVHNNNILDYLPEYEEFLRSYGY
jgi:hypothetical protein